VALGERDCSTQRRHQKLVEEAPAPGLTRQQRLVLHELAVRVVRGTGLRNAATAEFLYAPDGSFYFLEVNARLQVEHGVTELVTGLDLVREQLLVAAGEPLSGAVLAAADRAASPEAHAIELRISAEDPARDFGPVPGLVTRWREPVGPGVRIDSGIEQGWRVPPDYDPLLAKVLVVAPDRDAALGRARRAVRDFETGGVQTTLPFHAWLLSHPRFVAARVATDMVASEWSPGALRASAARRAAEAVAGHLMDGAALGSSARTPTATAARHPASTPDPVVRDARGSRDPAWREVGWRDARWPHAARRAPAGPDIRWRDDGRRRATERWS
jgi:acetyl/propionyl-CoA carboxylase alpha subunit